MIYTLLIETDYDGLYTLGTYSCRCKAETAGINYARDHEVRGDQALHILEFKLDAPADAPMCGEDPYPYLSKLGPCPGCGSED